MSGIPKRGIEFAGWDTRIFDGETKIDKLLDAQGWNGFAVYFYLCQRAYATDGYFYLWSYDDAATTARRMAGGIRSETVKAAVGTCVRVGLFDKRLLDSEGILTSRGIQRRFVAAIQKRSFRTVDKRYWLLDEAETAAGKIVFLKNDPSDAGDSQPKNTEGPPSGGGSLPEDSDVLPEDSDVLPEDAPKSKVKKSKVKKGTVQDVARPAVAPDVRAQSACADADDGYERFLEAYPKIRGDPARNYYAYLRALDAGATQEQLLAALAWQRDRPEWQEQGGRFVPSPEKWLRNRGWMQAPPAAATGDTTDAQKIAAMRRLYDHLMTQKRPDNEEEER